MMMGSENSSLSYFSHLYLMVILSITSIIFPLLTYVVLTKSTKEMSAFKIYLCLEMFWSFFFSVIFGLMRPIVYFPLMIARITGPLNVLCTIHGCHLAVELLFFAGAAYAQSLFCIAFFRLWRVLPMALYFNMDFGHRRFIFLSMMLVIPCIIYVTPVVLARNDTEKMLPYVKSIIPNWHSLVQFKNQLVIYNNPENDDFWIKVIYILLSLTVLFIVTISPVVLIVIGFMTRHSKARMSALRYKMSIMLFKTLIIQVILAFTMLAFPLITAIIFAKLQISYSDDVVQIAGIIASTHSLAEFSSILYTIRPYRRHLFALFSNFGKFLGIPKHWRNSSHRISFLSNSNGLYSISENPISH